MTLSYKSQVMSLLALAASMLLTSCAVGPNFKKPAAPQVTGYTTSPLSTTSSSTNVAGGEAQRFVSGEDISGEWWTLFHSQPLNDLIERSLTNNPSLKAAQAALAMARENVLAQRGAYYPSVAGSFSASRQNTSSQILKAQEEQARFAWVATDITLTANVVAAAIQEASLREQVAETRHLIAINSNLLQILRNQLAQGYANRLAVAAQESQLAQLAATLPPLLAQLAEQRDLLAVLSGGFPSEDLPEKFELSSLQLPQELPVSLPSQLVEQRPDVRQAEENLHAASAQIGIAVANRLPNFTLTADVGTMALEFGQMFAGGAGFWTLAGRVTQPIFQGGTLLHRERAAKAAYVQAAEQYRSTVLTAFQNVADTLNALEQDADALKADVAAKDAAEVTFNLTRLQWQNGYANYQALLSAEQAYDQTMISLVQAQANRYADTAALFQALGGGWWNRADLAKDQKGGT